MSQKFIISKSGFDAGTTTNPDNLIFSSDYNTLKYFVSAGTNISITGNGNTQGSQLTINHNLGYIPFFVCFVNTGSGYFFIPRNEQTAAPNSTLYANAYADNSNLYLTLSMNWVTGSVATVNYFYKIYKNNLGI